MINENSIYSKLTPSAKEAINELAEVYKASLIEKAYSIAKAHSSKVSEISIRDILEAQQSSEGRFIPQNSKISKEKRQSMLFMLAGLLYAMGGFLIYLFQNNREISIRDNLGIFVGISGLCISLLGYFYNQYFLLKGGIKDKQGLGFVDDYEVVKRWQTIERLTMSIMKSNNLIDNNSNSVNQVIKYLKSHFAQTESDALSIRELLMVRNRILHEGYQLSEHEKKQYIDTANNIIQRLEHSKV